MVNDEMRVGTIGSLCSVNSVYAVQDVLQDFTTETPSINGEVEAVTVLDEVAKRIYESPGEDGIVARL